MMSSPAPAPQDDMIQQEILKAAIRLYQKFGPNGFTMDDLASAAGRSRTSLYYYYKNRDEIYQAVMDKIARDMDAEEQSKHAEVMYSWHKKLIHHESGILNEILADATRRKEIRAILPGDQD